MSADGEEFWTRDQYRALAGKYEGDLFRYGVTVIRLMDQIDRLVVDLEGRGAWDAANRANAELAHTRAELVEALKSKGWSVPYIARAAKITPRRVRQILSTDRESGKSPEVSG